MDDHDEWDTAMYGLFVPSAWTAIRLAYRLGRYVAEIHEIMTLSLKDLWNVICLSSTTLEGLLGVFHLL